ncbi:MAG: sensor histidine kinase [Chroococcales cyanobacterium]
MNLNWLDLLLGLGLGIVGSRIFYRSQRENATTSTASEPELSIGKSSVESTDCEEKLAKLNTELKQMQLAYQMAAQMSAFKSGFLARTAHELRSPLNSLIGLHQLILADLCDNPEEEREFIHQANLSAFKLIKLIDEIIDVSKTEHGTHQLEIQPVQLASVLEQAYSKIHLQAANRNLHFHLSPPESNIYVLADSRRFLQVLIMLLDTSVTRLEEGSIKLYSETSTELNQEHIYIELPCSPRIWQESVTLMQDVPPPTPEMAKLYSQKEVSGLGMNLFLSQLLMEVMQGHITILDVSPKNSQTPITRLQCSIPLASADVVARTVTTD